MKTLYRLILFLVLVSTVAVAQHYKKDGSPDRRYKGNNAHTTYKSNSTYSHSTQHYSFFKRHSTNTSNRSSRSHYFGARDIHGRIKRSGKVRHDFMKMTGYPKGRPGYVIDHIVPLKEGGCDCPSNMQWQTIQSAKEKDKWE